MEFPIKEFTTPTGIKRMLTEKEATWLGHYLQCANATEAARLSGSDSPKPTGAQIKRRLSSCIQSNMRKMIGNCAPDALESIYQLAKNCPDPKVKLTASQDLLNRAGYKEAVKVEVSINDMSDKDIDKQIEALLNKGNIIEAEIVEE